MKVKVHYYISDNGDGSASVRFFPNEEALNKEIAKNEEDGEYDLSEGGVTEILHDDEFEVVEHFG